jgi:predicted DNA-binding transcriptional regulator YafY
MRLDKATALLRLARRLAGSAEGLALEDIAAEFEVDRRTAERMRDAVRDLFPQMQEIRSGKTKRFRIPGGLDPFFEAPSVEELADLAMAARGAADLGQPSRAENLRALGGKIEARIRPAQRLRYATDVEALALSERIALRPGPRPACDPANLRLLRTALLAVRRVRFTYLGAGGSAIREVDPCGLLFGSVYYLVGRRVGAEAAVLWRLDRISRPEILTEPAQPPTGFELQAFCDQSFGVFQEPVSDISLWVSPQAAQAALQHRFHPTQSFERLADGALRLRMQTGGLLELCWHLFTWRGEIRIEGPESLRDMMAEEVARFAA